MGIIKTLQVLGSWPSLLGLATRLMGKVWKKQNEVYPNVRDFLTRPLPSSLPAKEVREIQLARVAVIRDVCLTR